MAEVKKSQARKKGEPRTIEEVQELLRRYGLTKVAVAEYIGVSHQVVRDLLRPKGKSQLKGHRGAPHRAAVALGLKLGPAGFDPIDLSKITSPSPAGSR